jgi:hypothetical protein
VACVWLIIIAAIALGQLAVDATGPIRQRKREALTGRGGGVGRKLPLRVAIESTGAAPDVSGKTVVEFTLTNSGKSDIALPISPHAGDFEPSDPKVGYTVTTLGLRISLRSKPGAIFPGGAELYGNTKSPGTLAVLAPGDSIRILARVALPDFGSAKAEAFGASASLGTETLKTVNGQVVSDSTEIGFARSEEYTVDSIPRTDTPNQ